MPNWYWDKKTIKFTPSQEKGLSYETEIRYRREGVRFIFELGKTMALYHLTMATAAVYFHRFYMFHAFQDFPRYVVATCCLFLAGKAEETPKKCRDIVRIVRTLTNDLQFGTFGQDPREEIMVLERVLLQTIKFDLQVDHPYASIIKFAKSLKGDADKRNKMVQMSWTFVNDSLCTTLCLQWEPEIIAIAVMHLAVKLSKFEVKDWTNRKGIHKDWWDQFVDNLDMNDLEEVCHQVLDLYTQPTTPTKDAADSPPPPSANSPSDRASNAKGVVVAPQPPLPQSVKGVTPPPPKSRPQTPPPMPPSAKTPVGKPPIPSLGPPLPGGVPQPPLVAGYPPQGQQFPPPPQGSQPPPPPSHGGYPPPPPPANPALPAPGSYLYPPSGTGYHQGPPPGGYAPHPSMPHGGPPHPHYQTPPGYPGNYPPAPPVPQPYYPPAGRPPSGYQRY